MTKENVDRIGNFLCKEFLCINEIAYMNGNLIVTFFNQFGEEDVCRAPIPPGNANADMFELVRKLTIQLVCNTNPIFWRMVQ